MKRPLTSVLPTLLLAGWPIVASPVVNPANGHQYILLGGSWTEAESLAVTLGGHLVTINDAAENTWVWETFGVSGPFSIGLNDASQEGTFVWVSGEPVTFTNWWCRTPIDCEPNNLGGIEHFVGINNYVWSDNQDEQFFHAIAEVVPEGEASIGVFFDLAGTTCSATQPPVYTPGTAYVLALLGGLAPVGILSAGFRLEGMPAGWFANAVPPPGGLISRDPLGASGGAVTLAGGCKGGVVLLCTINYLPTSVVPETYLRISGDLGYYRQCPWLYGCLVGDFCVAGGEAILNGSHCTVVVEPKSWSLVKGLYRE